MTTHPDDWTRQEAHAWALLQAARTFADEFPRHNTEGDPVSDPVASFRFDAATGDVHRQASRLAKADLHYQGARWQAGNHLPAPVREILALYLPVLGTHDNPDRVIAHLGQSIDSTIATLSGDACFVTGEENRKHLHRLRSLCQAVLVGAGTATLDDPQLTTRAVSGANPVRVIVDPHARVSDTLHMLGDGEAPVWLLHEATIDLDALPALPGTRRLSIPGNDGVLQPPDIVASLAAAGIRRLFIEGGGVTVSRFVAANCLDRLQIAVAPLLVGQGTPALQLPPSVRMQDALRPACTLYRMGADVLWDFDLGASPSAGSTDDPNSDSARVPPLQKIL